ncbi:MAG: ACT domain-containing protein, partial [Chloroflexi bacterium]|nr:ACT domain-containing protein [Chloroflexota bacterium]
VRSSYSTNEGTIIHEGKGMENRNKVRGIAHDSDVAKVTLVDVPDRPGVAWQVFTPLAEATINVDTIVQNIGSDGVTDLSFTVTKAELPQAVRIVEKVAHEIGARDIQSSLDMAKISIVGTGIQSHPGYAARMFKALADAGVNIDMISTSEIRITCLIDDHQVATAAKALHKAFQLEKPDA